jgi:hypothetical protein
MVQKNPNSDFILKATYPHCGKLCLTFGPNFEGLGTKRKVGRKKGVIGSFSHWLCLPPPQKKKKYMNETRQAVWNFLCG